MCWYIMSYKVASYEYRLTLDNLNKDIALLISVKQTCAGINLHNTSLHIPEATNRSLTQT